MCIREEMQRTAKNSDKDCKEFLELILQKKIAKVMFPDYERTIDIRYDAKSVRLDVMLEDDEHTIYNLEMQATPQEYLVKRSRYYQDLIDMDLIEKGEKYGEIGKTIIIFICTFDPFEKGRHIYTFENMCREDSSLCLDDGTEKVFVNTKGTMDDVSTEFQTVLDYFNGQGAEGSLAQRFDDEVLAVRRSEKWRREYMTLEIFMQDERDAARKEGRVEGRAEGRAEGQVEGRIEGIKQVALNMLKSKEPVDKIMELTGLSKDEILALQ